MEVALSLSPSSCCAFTCLIAYYYIAETTLVYLDSKLRYPVLKPLLKIIFLIVCFTGSMQSVGVMWALGDIGFGRMCYLNFIAIVLLSKTALKVLKDYDEQMKLGLDPVFDPRKAGVENADFWIEYSDKYDKRYLNYQCYLTQKILLYHYDIEGFIVYETYGQKHSIQFYTPESVVVCAE